MTRQIPIPLSLTPSHLSGALREFGRTLERYLCSGQIDDGMQCTAPLSPTGSFGGTRQAYDSTRTVEGYDRRK